MFDLMDVDGNGYADEKELYQMFGRFSAGSTPPTEDSNKNIRLSKEEFIRMAKKK